MIYIFGFEGVRQVEESKHSLPSALTVTCLADGFTFVKREEYIFETPVDYEIYSGDIDRIVLEKWEKVLEEAMYELGEAPKLIFYNERDFRLFNAMKNRFGIHTGALGYYSIEAMSRLADSEENKSEFRLIRDELKNDYKSEANKFALEGNRRGTIEDKIERTCAKYGMKVEFKSGTAYIKTYAGEWYFSYNDRPITLYHKNAVPVKGRNGRLKKHSHVQPVELYSPLKALQYIRNHEAAEEKRLMNKAKPPKTIK